MPTMTVPSKEAMRLVVEGSDDFDLVQEEVVDEYRWGNIYEAVIREKSTDKYWAVTYQVQSGDRYHHSFENEDEVEFYQVEPRTKTIVEYVKIKN